MHYCQACGYEQQQGNFCGGCGTALSFGIEQKNSAPLEQTAEAATRYQPKRRSSRQQADSQPNRLQIEVRAYIAYFKTALQNPADALAAPPATKTFVTTLVLLLLSAVLAAYVITEDVLGVLTGKGTFLLSAGLLYSLLVVMSFATVFVVTSFFSETRGVLGTCKTITGFYPAVIILNLMSLLLEIAGVTTLAVFFFCMAVILVSILIGAFVIVDAVRQSSRSINGFYAYVVYFLLSFVILTYISSTLARSILDHFLTRIAFW